MRAMLTTRCVFVCRVFRAVSEGELRSQERRLGMRRGFVRLRVRATLHYTGAVLSVMSVKQASACYRLRYCSFKRFAFLITVRNKK